MENESIFYCLLQFESLVECKMYPKPTPESSFEHLNYKQDQSGCGSKIQLTGVTQVLVFDSICQGGISRWVKIKPPRIGPQVLVHVSTYQANPFGVPIFDPQPFGFGATSCKIVFGRMRCFPMRPEQYAQHDFYPQPSGHESKPRTPSEHPLPTPLK